MRSHEKAATMANALPMGINGQISIHLKNNYAVSLPHTPSGSIQDLK